MTKDKKWFKIKDSGRKYQSLSKLIKDLNKGL